MERRSDEEKSMVVVVELEKGGMRETRWCLSFFGVEVEFVRKLPPTRERAHPHGSTRSPKGMDGMDVDRHGALHGKSVLSHRGAPPYLS
jgi:hypothetical protein